MIYFSDIQEKEDGSFMVLDIQINTESIHPTKKYNATLS
jgi:hypothetical protein